MSRSTTVVSLIAAVVQGAAFAVVSHLLARQRERTAQRSLPEEAERLDRLERRIAATELLCGSQIDTSPEPASPPISRPGQTRQPADDKEEAFDGLAGQHLQPPGHIRSLASPAPACEATAVPRIRPAASYLDEGNVYYEVGNYERAAERFSRAIELQVDLAPAYFNRALALVRLGQLDAALADYDRAAKLLPDAEVFNNRGVVHLQRGELELAATDFHSALEKEPADTDAAINLGLVHLQAGDAERAHAAFSAVLKREPANEAASDAAALALAELGRVDEGGDRDNKNAGRNTGG